MAFKAKFPRFPAPKPGTRYRVIGPVPNRGGMYVYRVFEVLDGGRIGEQQGEDCLLEQEALDRARDLASGKKLVYFGPHTFRKKAL